MSNLYPAVLVHVCDLPDRIEAFSCDGLANSVATAGEATMASLSTSSYASVKASLRRQHSFPALVLVTAIVSIGLCSISCATRSWALLTTTSSQSESGFSTDIVSVDGKQPTRENLGVEPGRHWVEAVGTSRPVGVNARAGTQAAILGVGLVSPLVGAGIALANWADATHSTRMRACFIARPGRTYEIRTYVESQEWHIDVVDQTTTYDVKSPCKKPHDTPVAKPPAKKPET